MAIIGIDLGTSNSAAATLRGGRPVIIPSAEGVSLGGKAFPSYVALTADGQTLVGEPARRQAVTNPEGTTTAFKRLMGQRKKIMLRDQNFSPEQLSAFLLKKIKQDAEAFLGESVDKAVVTVPAYFDDNQRSSTKDAANIAGIEVARLVNEPTAASLAYGLDRAGEDLRIAVIDFGGGTLDITIMDFGKGVFEVVSTSGDTHLGGTDMDQRIFEYLADAFKRDKGLDIRDDRNASARLNEAVEIAKIELSAATIAHITLPYLMSADGQVHHLDVDLTRTELDRLVHHEIERCRGPIEQALKDAHSEPKDINRIVFVGGPTRMPCVRSFFEEMFGRPAEMGVDPMECVASGAAIQAGVLTGEVGDIVLVDVTPLTLGVETVGGVANSLIAHNTPIPVKHAETFSTAADMQTSVTIHVYQGERPMASDNTSLGQFNLDGLPPAPRGIPKIDVTFDIDASGILNVTAKDTATGKSQSITISGSTRLSDEEKDRMIKDAERYAEEDKKRRAQADQLNAADSTCYAAEKMLDEFSDKLTDDLRQRIEIGLRTTRETVTSRDAEQATERAAALEKDLKEAGVVIYAQSKEAGPYTETKVPDGSDSSSSGTHQRVVDAEYQDSKPS